MTTSYIDYVKSLSSELRLPSLWVCPEVIPEVIYDDCIPRRIDIINGIDIVDYITDRKMKRDFVQYNSVFVSRVIEHIPIRVVDWYIVNLYQVMNKNAKLFAIVPDMDLVTDEIRKEWNNPNIDIFKIHRLNHEMFNEGNNIWDRHCFYTCLKSMTYMFEKEGLFKCESYEYIDVDSNTVPKQLKLTFVRI